jgi:signal transduction histidine kinase/CheY-like chemotaxis protein
MLRVWRLRRHDKALRRRYADRVRSDPRRILVLAPDATVADQVRALAGAREGSGPAVGVTVAEGPVVEAIARVSALTKDEPVGMVVRTQEGVIAAIEGGADDACLAAGLDVQAFVAFLDRVALRARWRRDVENARASALQGEKLVALGTLVAGVAHEINNPLTVVVMMSQGMRSMVEPLLRAQAEIFNLASRQQPASADELRQLAALARTGAAASELRRLFDDVDSALDTIRDIVRGLRQYARTESDEKLEPVEIPELVDQVVRVLGKGLSTDATLERDYERDLPVLLLPRSKITQVLTNLLINAAQAISQVDRPMHRVRVSARCDGEVLALSVSDTGPGISPENLERIFDPFFTTKRLDGVVGGSGLGLSISRSILHSLGGDLVAESVHGQGATFVAIVPTEGRLVERKARTFAAPDEGGSAGARASLLVIDDDERILRSVAVALRGRYDVILAGDGQEAIDLLSSGSVPDAVLSDVSMPLVNGPALYDWLRDNRPALASRLLFMTASVYDHVAQRAAKTGRPVLEKPLTRERLLAALRDALQPAVDHPARGSDFR